MKRQILYRTANGKLGVLSDKSKVEVWREKYQIVEWWYADDVITNLHIVKYDQEGIC